MTKKEWWQDNKRLKPSSEWKKKGTMCKTWARRNEHWERTVITERSKYLIRKTVSEHGFRNVWWRIISTHSYLSFDQTVTSQLYCQIVHELSVSQETHCVLQHQLLSWPGDKQAAQCLMNIDPTLHRVDLHCPFTYATPHRKGPRVTCAIIVKDILEMFIDSSVHCVW